MQDKPIGYFELLRKNSNYRYLWFGQVVSLFGDWFNLIASAALISSLPKSGLAVGGLFIIRMLAPFVVSPIAGVASDRFNRKYLLILTDLLRALVVLGFLFVRDSQGIWLLYVLTAIQLSLSGFFFPARNAILPDLVAENELGAANALSSATWSVMLAIGAGLGGIVAGAWGIYPAFIIDSMTFIFSALLLSRIVYVFPYIPKRLAGKVLAIFDEYAEGLRYLYQHKDILVIALQKGLFALTATGGYQILQVILAEQKYEIGAGGGISLGIMYAVTGVGTGLGPIIARRFTGDRSKELRIAIGIGYLLCVIGLLVMAPLFTFGIVLIGILMRAIASGINWVFSTQLLLENVWGQVRGRVFSTEFAIFTLLNAIGTAASGWILDNTSLGISGLLIIMMISTLIVGLFWYLWYFLTS